MIKPVIAIRGIWPSLFLETEIKVGRPSSVRALKLAQNNYQNQIILAVQENPEIDVVDSEKDLINVAFLATVVSVKESYDDFYKVRFLPFRRVKINTLLVDEENANYKTLVKYQNFDIQVNDAKTSLSLFNFLQKVPLNFSKANVDPNTKIIIKRIKNQIDSLKKIENDTFISWFVPLESPEHALEYTDYLQPILLTSIYVDVLDFKTDFYTTYLNQIHWDDQAEMILEYLKTREHDEELEKQIERKMKDTLTKQQKEFLLREKIKLIRKELDETGEDEIDVFDIEKDSDKKLSEEKKAAKKRYPKSVAKIVANEKSKLKNLMSSSPDANVSRNYIDLITILPWRKVSIDDLDIEKTRNILNEGHFGLKEVKERVLEYIAVMVNNNNKNEKSKNVLKLDKNHLVDLNLFEENEDDDYNRKLITSVPILALVGPPGTGKTSLAKGIAEALNKKFVKISLGGVKDESEIRGHRRTYVGALPGKIVAALKRAGVSNPVILLDEIDKMSSGTLKGDASAALLEVLDPEQNHKFQDHYLEHEYDLSKCLFIATANYFHDIPEALIDRVEVINLSSYTILEKVQIARNHLLSKVIKDVSLENHNFKIDDETLKYIITHYTLEAGVRNLRRVLDKLARKIVVKILNKELNEADEFVITEKIVFDLLGVHKFSDDVNDKEAQIGSVNGLAYTSYGGSTLKIEINLFPGKGKILLTGQLKDVMQESAQTALSYVRSNAEYFGIPNNFTWDAYDIHIHVPAGAVPKDGPSAGVTFTTAIVSALTRRKVGYQIGMTGEITLRGKVLAIGGLKEKSIAAHKFGIKTVFIPKDNEKDLIEIPDEVRNEINYIPVKEYTEIFDYLFKDITADPLPLIYQPSINQKSLENHNN